jgi:hypothetical protein
VYSFYPAQPLVTEHVISMADTKTNLKPKLLANKERLDITNIVEAI